MDDLMVKYSRLISYAQQNNVQNLHITEDDNVLRISGSASENVKNKLWDMYGEIDPDMRAGDLILNIETVSGSGSKDEEMYEVKPGDSLSKIAGQYPGMSWQKIYEANKDTIDNPDKIFAGQKIRIPHQE